MRYDSPIGGDLTALQHQMKGMPTEVLQQYVAQKHPINSLPAGVELSRRAMMQQGAQAGQAQAAQSQPTVVASAAQQLGLGSLASQGQPQGFAKGGIIAFNGEKDSKVPNADESWMNRVNREAHERGVRETNEYLASIKDPEEREKARRALYGPASDPIGGLLSGLASMGAATKDVLSAPVRIAAGLAEKYLPVPSIPESFYGGNRSSLTPYMDKLKQEQAGQSGNVDEAALSDRAKFAYGPSSGWSGVSPVASGQPTSVEQKIRPSPVPSSVRTPSPFAGPAPAAAKPETPAAGIPSLVGEKQQGLYNILGKAEEFFAKPPAEMTEADLSRIREEEFKKRQAVSAPYLKQMKDMLDQERAGIKKEDVGTDALMRFGLGLIGKRRSDIGAAGINALDYYEKTKEKEAAAISENNRAQRLLLEANLRDQRGDYEGADRAAKEARTAQQNANVLAGQAMGKRVDIASKGAEAERKDEVEEAKRLNNERMYALKQELAAARASGNLAQIQVAQARLEQAAQAIQLQTMTANANLRDKAIDNVNKEIATNYKLQAEIAKDPSKKQKLIDDAILALGGTVAGGGVSGTRIKYDTQGNEIK